MPPSPRFEYSPWEGFVLAHALYQVLFEEFKLAA